MALRTIRKYGDEILTKSCKKVENMTPAISALIDDILETMHESEGAGLAAPQVGSLKRICAVDITGTDPYIFINPEIIFAEGEQRAYEGCLSVPDKVGIVKRPSHIKVKALDREMKPFELEADGFLARTICHEVDHLNGKMYTDLVEGEPVDVELVKSVK